MTIQWQGASFIPHSGNIFHGEPMNIQDDLNRIKTYSSGFKLINKAIQRISKDDLKPQVAWKVFNDTMAGYNTVINPFPVISCIQDLQELETQLENHSLGRLWNALFKKSIDEFQIETIEQKREWFEDEENQPLLDTVTILKFQIRGLISLPREIYRLRNLKKLDLSGNSIEFLPDSIKIWTQLEELNLSCNELTDLPHGGMKHLTSLVNLNVSGNALKRLPESIGCLKR